MMVTGMQTIPIVLACDSNMLAQTFVAMASVLECRREDYQIEFCILFPENEVLNKEYEERLRRKYNNFTIRYQFIDDSVFSGVVQYISHVTRPSNYRLLIPDLFPEWDKCIYLDGDILVFEDIIMLWNQELDSEYIAGGVTTSLILDSERKKRYQEEFHFPDVDRYINAGVLVLNLAKLREDNMTPHFIELVNTKHFPDGDQDVLNFACAGRIKLLPYQYNTCVIHYAYKEILKEISEFASIEEAFENPVIIHYAGPKLKPWENLLVMYAKKWWAIAEDIIERDEKKQLYENAVKVTKDLFLLSLKEKIEESNGCVILGFGINGKWLIEWILDMNPGKPICCCDNDAEKWGQVYNGVECKELEKTVKENRECLFINSLQNPVYHEAVHKQVMDLGICPENIVSFQEVPFYIKESIDFAFKAASKNGINMEKIEKCLETI